jgi:hypothetical protein
MAMFDWIRKLRRAAPASSELQQMMVDLKSPEGFPITELRPVLIPSSIFELDHWIGPYHHFENLPVSLTWAYMRPNQTMQYLNSATAVALEAKGCDWRSAALNALSGDVARQPWTHEWKNASGAVRAVALMHDDGVGPSRLCMLSRYDLLFPEGFTFFVPERSCAILLSNDAESIVRDRITSVVERCHRDAEVPMHNEPFTSDELRASLAQLVRGRLPRGHVDGPVPSP